MTGGSPPRAALQGERGFSDTLYAQGSEFERSSKQYMRDLVPRGASLAVLDVGSGTGLNARVLRDMGHRVTPIDLSPVAVDKLRADGFDAQVCDVMQGLPFAADSFDLIYASDIVEHISDTQAFLAELARVLRPGGSLLLSTPNSAFWPFRLLALIGQTASEMQHPWHLRFFSRHSLCRHVTAAGLRVGALSGRHMYLVLPDSLGRLLPSALGLQREYRLTSGKSFWHWSRFARHASGFWADSFIISATKPPVPD